MTTYYNGTYINWLDNGIFKIERKKFGTLRGAMDYIDKRRKSARGNNNLDTSHSDGHTKSVVAQQPDKQSRNRLETK